MKRSIDYLPNIREKYILNNKDIILEDDFMNSSFDEFVKINNIGNITSNIYKLYIQENFNENKHRYYSKYQNHLYESILQSYSASDLMKMENFGRKALNNVRTVLAEHGLSLKDSRGQ